MKRIVRVPLSKTEAAQLKAGDRVYLSGTIYTARDAAHKRLFDLLAKGEALPLPLAGAVIYYVGPSPAKPGQVIGSAGPTTSYRMDAYSPALIEKGQIGMIGKGMRGPEVIEAMIRHGAVYFGAVGGAAALLAGCIKKSEIVAYEDLGPEAIRRLEVEELPVVVVIDSTGNNLYRTGPEAYRASLEDEHA